MGMPDYRSVPTDRSLVTDDASYRLWRDYGNDHDGPQAERCRPGTIVDGHPCGSDVPLSQEQFEWWWGRNSYHNLHFIVNRKRVIDPKYIWGKPSGDLRNEVNKFTVLRTNPFFFKFGYLFSGYRSDKPTWPILPEYPGHELGPGGGAYDPIGFKSLGWEPLA